MDRVNESLALLLSLTDEKVARSIVVDICTPQSIQAFGRIAAVACARKMLGEGKERRDIAYRLAAIYDISLKSAYRRIGEALDLERPCFGTTHPGQ